MIFSKADMYPGMSMTLPTTDLTIAEGEENQFYSDNTSVNPDHPDSKVVVDKKMILGSIGLLVGMVVLIGILDREGVE